MHPDIAPLLLVVALAVLVAVWSAALWVEAWLLDRRSKPAPRHAARPGRQTYTRRRGRFVYDDTAMPAGVR